MKRFTAFIFIIIYTSVVSGQSTKVYPDAGSWNTFSIDYVYSKRITFLFTEELRFRENYSRLNLFYTNLGIEYKIHKNLRTALVYRWIDKLTDENSFSFRHRLMWDVVAKLPINKKWSMSYRHRLQVEIRDYNTDYYGRIPEWYSRSRVEIGFQVNNRINVGFSTEMRYQLYNRRFESSQYQWHRIRFQAGGDYKLNENNKLGIYYLLQREFNIVQPQRIYITGIEFTHKIKH